MYDSISRNSGEQSDERERTLVAVASLLHDVGHSAFSHSFEMAFDGFKHESMTLRLIREYEPIAELLQQYDESFAEDIVPFVEPDSRRDDKWSYRIVSSQLDADRLDYMLRDAMFAGLQGHGFDLYRLLDLLSVQEGKLTVDEYGMATLEAYLLMRLHLHEIVYFHKGVRGAQALLVAIFRRCADLVSLGDEQHLAGLPDLVSRLLKSFATNPSNVDLSDFVRFGEHHCWSAFDEWSVGAKDHILKDLCERLVVRRPFKAITLMEYDKGTQTQQMRKAVRYVSEALKISEKHADRYYLHLDEPKMLAYKTFDPHGTKPDEEIWLSDRTGSTKRLSEMNSNPVIQATRIPRISTFLLYPDECRKRITDLFPHKEFLLL